MAVSVSSFDSDGWLGLLAGSTRPLEARMSLPLAGAVAVVFGEAVKRREQSKRVTAVAVPANATANNLCWRCFFFVAGLGDRGWMVNVLAGAIDDVLGNEVWDVVLDGSFVGSDSVGEGISGQSITTGCSPQSKSQSICGSSG